MEPFYRRLSSYVCVDCSSPPSETGVWGFRFGAFQQIYAVYDSRRLRGWNRFTGGSLPTFASILVRLQVKREGGDYVLAFFNKFVLCMIFDCRRLRGWNVFTSGSLVTFAPILVRLQAERKTDDYVLGSLNKFMLCMILAGRAVEPFYRRLSSHVCVDFVPPPSET